MSQPPQPAAGSGRLGGLLAGRHPALMVVAGSACTSSSAALIKLSGVSAGTAAFLRCGIALLVLVPMTVAEYRRLGPRPARLLALDASAGLLLGVDYIFWTQSIHTLGASVATLLLNVQLVVFPLLARAFSGIRLPRRFWLTAVVLLGGVALAGGALGAEPGSDPAAGAAFGAGAGVAFAGYLFLIRLGGGRGHPHTVHPVCASTLAAGVSSCILGSLWTGVDVNPGWPAWAWLVPVAIFGQVLAWLLINPALPRLSPGTGATLLLLQPVLALAMGVGLLGERPTLAQYAGCVIVVLVVWRSGRTARAPRS